LRLPSAVVGQDEPPRAIPVGSEAWEIGEAAAEVGTGDGDVADVVSSLGGVPVEADAWGVDVCLGASQKCISAPPGLALVSVSKRAWEIVRSRKDKIPSYYLSLGQWDEWWKHRKLFPYTPSVSDIYALDEALDMIFEEGLRSVFSRHAKVSKALLAAIRAMGLTPFPASDEFHSPTVTAFRRPTA
jgi:alanine-glyoxylate transaminase/serine-glyoxylate transaminase/serine-pyruvate transaminase